MEGGRSSSSVNFEDLGEAEDHVGVQTELVLLAVGDESLDESSAFGDFLLG